MSDPAPSDYERGLQDAGMAALPYIDPARTIDLMRALAVLAGNLPAAADVDGDRVILDRAREILRRHGHGISASCTPTCQRQHDAQAGMREPTYAALHEWPPLPVAPLPDTPTRYARGHVRRDIP